MTSKWGLAGIVVLLGGDLLRLPAAVPPLDADGTVLEKPLWLSVRLVEDYVQVPVHPGNKLDRIVFSQGSMITIHGRLDLVQDRYAGKLKIVPWRVDRNFAFELDKSQTCYIPGVGTWTAVLSRSRDRWNKIELFK
jgi:hypothetical protein